MSDRSTSSDTAQRLSPLTRRRMLQVTAGSGIGTTVLGATTVSGQQGSAAVEETTLVFDNQVTPGNEIVLAELTTAESVVFVVHTADHERDLGRGEIAADIDTTGYVITVDETITQDSELYVSLYPSEGGQRITRDNATVTPDQDASFTDGLSVTRIDADPAAGFNYPDFLYIPSLRQEKASGPVLCEPNNTGKVSDTFEEHLSAARNITRGEGNGGSGRQISERLGVPFLVPAFPRPESDPVDWRHYTHQLDTETMQITDGDLARIDKQLVRMVEDARGRIANREYTVNPDGMILNGFSASGNFVNRFAAVQPDEVISVSAGGINGTAFLPISEAAGHTLNYQIGTANLEELIGEPFDLESFREVNQFLYMGALDFNDTIPYTDAWSDSQREIALDVYGENMQRDRMPYCQSVYEQQDVTAAFKIYDREGHTPRPAIDDIVAFHRRSLADESIEDFNEDLSLATRPTDPDGDGTFEDINGDGEFDIFDIKKLYNMLTQQ